MPVYEYKCQDHDVFYELATVEDSDKPCSCPKCGKLSARIIVIPPEILKMAPNIRAANALNEKNQHEPTYSSQERRELDEEHSNGCGCAKTLSPSKMLYTAQGEKMFPSMRPWMISH